MVEPFAVKDCTLISIATGERAQNLRELRNRLEDIHPGCIYYHFWGGLLVPRFDDPEFQNDFASWAYHGLNDLRLAERLGIIDPTVFKDMEELRRELIEVMEERLDESEIVPWAKADKQFYFIRSKIVVMDTRMRIDDPLKLKDMISHMPISAVFYHFIDARRRTPDRRDDFSRWLSELDDPYRLVAERIRAIDPYFTPLAGLRDQLVKAFEEPSRRDDGWAKECLTDMNR
jgi:hypothetical protein